VRIDKTHRRWLLASLLILALCVAIYAPYALRAPQGPRGGSAPGLLFGSLGFGFMLFAAALGARKRVPTWRLGRAQNWMRGHLWLGLLSLPLILLHGGFHFGGTLTAVLMWLLIATVASGIFGAVLQNYLPRTMTDEVPLETIYAEIGRVRALLCEEADRLVESLCGPLGVEHGERLSGQRAGGFTAMRTLPAARLASSATASWPAAAVAPAISSVLLNTAEAEPLRQFYLSEMRPFLNHPHGHGLADAALSQSAFASLRTLLPPQARAALADLEDISTEARQLMRQQQLHRWLHGWLIVHVPLSLALIVLGAAHAVMALRY
jgi:hypothetical protein